MNLPIDLIKNYMTKGLTPKGLIQQIAGTNNPIINNLIDLTEKGDIEQVKQITNNVLKERGLNVDLVKEVANLRQQLNIK